VPDRRALAAVLEREHERLKRPHKRPPTLSFDLSPAVRAREVRKKKYQDNSVPDMEAQLDQIYFESYRVRIHSR
jgi:hypothetical protein